MARLPDRGSVLLMRSGSNFRNSIFLARPPLWLIRCAATAPISASSCFLGICGGFQDFGV